ncbi:MAG: polymer-forming cytoskeletal protein [Bacteroidota bacterium]
MARTTETENGSHNQIAKGTVISGDIKTEGVIRIDGTLTGSIDSKGKVVIGPTGRIEGNVYCENANIQGELKGKIEVSGLLSLQATAKLSGDVITSKLSIEPGAIFSATCQMGGVVKELNVDNERSGTKARETRELAQAE